MQVFTATYTPSLSTLQSSFNIHNITEPEAVSESSINQSPSDIQSPSYNSEEPGPSHNRFERSSSSFTQQTHEFALDGSGNSTRSWATLRLRSSAPSAKSLPVFFEGQDISGEVILNLRKPESIKSIVVTVKGIASIGLDERVFMHLSETVWHDQFGDPRAASTGDYRPKYSGKLVGSYELPFSIALPSKFHVPEKVAKDLDLRSEERLPPNIQNSGWDSAICYRLSLKIKRQGMFQTDGTISTLFGYTPLSRPDAPSDARRRAYKRNNPLPGPAVDPTGWHKLRRLDVFGAVFRQRGAKATYSISLANPLTYTRGSVIPIHLTVRSTDKQALDLLSNPSAPNVILRRKLVSRLPMTDAERLTRAAPNERESQPLAVAIWAPANESASETERCLDGEIIVPLSCTPSFRFGGFIQEYFIDVLPPSPAGFQPSDDSGVLSRTKIMVASAHAEDSPRPRAYITPDRNVSRRVAHADTLATLQGNAPVASRPTSRPNTGLTGASLAVLSRRDTPEASRSVSPQSPPSQQSLPRRARRRFSTF